MTPSDLDLLVRCIETSRGLIPHVFKHELIQQLRADARALWAYRVMRNAGAKGHYVSLLEYEACLLAHAKNAVAADPSLDPNREPT